MPQPKRLTQLCNIRSLAILLVALGHSIILYSSDWNLYQTSIIYIGSIFRQNEMDD